MPTVPDASGDASLLELSRDFIAHEHGKPGAVFLGVVHRLDRPVSGVVAFARTSKAARRLSAQVRARSVHKRYLGVAERPPREPSGELLQHLVKDEGRNLVRAVPAGPRSRDSSSRSTRLGPASKRLSWRGAVEVGEGSPAGCSPAC